MLIKDKCFYILYYIIQIFSIIKCYGNNNSVSKLIKPFKTSFKNDRLKHIHCVNKRAKCYMYFIITLT